MVVFQGMDVARGRECTGPAWVGLCGAEREEIMKQANELGKQMQQRKATIAAEMDAGPVWIGGVFGDGCRANEGTYGSCLGGSW